MTRYVYLAAAILLVLSMANAKAAEETPGELTALPGRKAANQVSSYCLLTLHDIVRLSQGCQRVGTWQSVHQLSVSFKIFKNILTITSHD